MNTWEWLNKLYYEVGHQWSDFDCQIAFKNVDGEQGWSRRKSFLLLSLLNDPEWISRVNNRTLLKNEVVLDFDRVILPERVLDDLQVASAITWAEKHNHPYSVFHTGSKGVHVHIFIKELAFMKQHTRYEARQKIVARFCGDISFVPNFSGDYAKVSDKVPIALEFVPHWKSGKPKTLIKSNFL